MPLYGGTGMCGEMDLALQSLVKTVTTFVVLRLLKLHYYI